MAQRPAYYKEIDDRFDKFELKQKEFGQSLDNMQVHQAEQMNRINEIHVLLAGTEYDKHDNGGMCGDFQRVKDKVRKNTNWRIMITAAGSVVVWVIGFVLVKFGSIISTIRELIKTP